MNYIKISLFLFILISFFSCDNKKKIVQDDTQEVKPEVNLIKEEVKIIPYPVDYDTTEWIELGFLDSSFSYDLRYATANNFVKEKMYDCGRCFIRPEVGITLVKIHEELKSQGHGGLKLFDCYRPRPFQQRLWDKVPNPKYVTNPAKGSMHNRGAAVDLTIIDKDGKELDMGTDFDFFGKEAHYKYYHNDTIQTNRKLLRDIMFKHGFKGITSEWWHFSFQLKNYALSDWVWNCKEEKQDTTPTIVPQENWKYKIVDLNGNITPSKHPDFQITESPYTSRPMYLRKGTYNAYLKMWEAAKKDGVQLFCISATRGFGRQSAIWESKWLGVKKVEGKNLAKAIPNPAQRALKILEYSSMPGTSRHHWGTDIDINALNNEYFDTKKGLKEYQWLKA
ncbi:MAG: M15 family metallopeptidase, partial [Saprospiraceae bacterium]